MTGSLTRVAGEDVGTYAIGQGDLDNGNYTITYVSADLTITPKTLTLSVTGNDKAYDGATDATVTTGSLVGIEGGDTVNVVSPSDFDFGDANAGEDK